MCKVSSISTFNIEVMNGVYDGYGVEVVRVIFLSEYRDYDGMV